MTQINFEITGEEVQRIAGCKLSQEQINKVLIAVENDSVLWDDIEDSIKDAVDNLTAMKLPNFIKELQNIARSVKRPDTVRVQMADTIPVVKPVFQDGVVYITDIDPELPEG